MAACSWPSGRPYHDAGRSKEPQELAPAPATAAELVPIGRRSDLTPLEILRRTGIGRVGPPRIFFSPSPSSGPAACYGARSAKLSISLGISPLDLHGETFVADDNGPGPRVQNLPARGTCRRGRQPRRRSGEY